MEHLYHIIHLLYKVELVFCLEFLVDIGKRFQFLYHSAIKRLLKIRHNFDLVLLHFESVVVNRRDLCLWEKKKNNHY